MSDLPSKQSIDREALDRIIQRAAELQTGEREIGDNLTPEEVLALGKEVGIPTRYLQQAILEHQTVGASPSEGGGPIRRWIGPGEVRAERVVQGDPESAITSLLAWMEKNELMVVQRQKAGWASWEPLRGMQAAIRRGTASLDTSKPKFMLSRADSVVATATQLESGYVHVSLTASLASTRRLHTTWGGIFFGLGATAAGAMAVLGLGPLALLPLIPTGVSGYATLKSYRPAPRRVLIGLERALDFLERGGVKPSHESVPKGPGLLELLAGEVRRAISTGSERASQRAEEAKRLKPRFKTGRDSE
ncbi:MAG: hypothetical protein AB7R55_10915 [Gemmatimonadales bacterium]